MINTINCRCGKKYGEDPNTLEFIQEMINGHENDDNFHIFCSERCRYIYEEDQLDGD